CRLAEQISQDHIAADVVDLVLPGNGVTHDDCGRGPRGRPRVGESVRYIRKLEKLDIADLASSVGCTWPQIDDVERRVDPLRDLILRGRAAEHDGVRTASTVNRVVVRVHNERVVAPAADRGLDDGARGNADIVHLAVRAAERAGIEIDGRGCGPS